MQQIESYLKSKGYHFTPYQIATFYTALQTKGFVILTGISGTGKTKLAQYFAQLLPQPKQIALLGASSQPIKEQEFLVGEESTDYWTFPIRADVASSLSTPFRVYLYHDRKIEYFCRVAEFRTQAGNKGFPSPWPEITSSELVDKDHEEGKDNKKFKTWFRVTHKEKLEKPLRFSEIQALYGYKSVEAALRNALIPFADPLETGSNSLFLSVRPDWRDGKGLLGYYNPLTRQYEWTPFLHFLLRAAQDYAQNRATANAWFVILDEMNLARVEYYFADFLSVLESGRDSQGWTNEPVRFVFPSDIEGEAPPKEIKLPPNLYIIGTVNVDETTHAFSPKVLDRAFTLELTDADFLAYPAKQEAEKPSSNEEDRQKLLENFSHNHQFALVDKQKIAAYVQSNDVYRQQLQTLNTRLRQYDLHFGYRIFDEIMSFMISGEENQFFKDQGGNPTAFDAAVLMKVLPKFYGSRGKLEAPLKAVLAWCINPELLDDKKIEDVVKNIENDSGSNPFDEIVKLYRYPNTAKRAQRMLLSLYTTGFAAFG